jgi:3,4-dihydroxy 2-butanone 4-phosphate synthase/GTP cyclohydrolase II
MSDRHNAIDRVAERVAAVTIPTPHGVARMVGYRGLRDDGEHVAVVYGDPTRADAPLVRVHSECFTGDVFGSLRCDCGPQLDASVRAIAAAGDGVILYLRQEGRGIGLLNKLRAYALQEQGLDTVEANLALGFEPDARDYRIGADMLRDLGVDRVRLLSNNPEKIAGLERAGIAVVERVPILVAPVVENVGYLETKERKMGHLYHVTDRREIVAA